MDDRLFNFFVYNNINLNLIRNKYWTEHLTIDIELFTFVILVKYLLLIFIQGSKIDCIIISSGLQVSIESQNYLSINISEV